MKFVYGSALFMALVLLCFVSAHISSCKKIDLKRIAVIGTDPVTNITETTAKANGNIIDLGTNTIDHGVLLVRRKFTNIE